jgi:hypothetical protein
LHVRVPGEPHAFGIVERDVVLGYFFKSAHVGVLGHRRQESGGIPGSWLANCESTVNKGIHGEVHTCWAVLAKQRGRKAYREGEKEKERKRKAFRNPMDIVGGVPGRKRGEARRF